MPPSEAVLLLLRKAAEDEALLDEVLESPRVTDAIFGFHAQQSGEKLLKAVLSQAGVLYPLTHRLGQLIDLIRDSGIALPPSSMQSTCLLRLQSSTACDVIPGDDEEALNRHATRQLLARLRAWVEGRILSE